MRSSCAAVGIEIFAANGPDDPNLSPAIAMGCQKVSVARREPPSYIHSIRRRFVSATPREKLHPSRRTLRPRPRRRSLAPAGSNEGAGSLNDIVVPRREVLEERLR